MNTQTFRSKRALTLIEVLMVVAVLMLLAAMLLPMAIHRDRMVSTRIACVNNQKQIGIAFKIWAQDNSDNLPMRVSVTNGGTLEFVGGPETFRHFLVMSNELNTPRILYCPKESVSGRLQATTFSGAVAGGNFAVPFTGNTNVSYFVGVDAEDTRPEMFLTGDHNLTNGTALTGGLLELTTNRLTGWTAQLHVNQGNLGLADGSVLQVNTPALRWALENSGVATNRLAMP